MGRGDWRPLDGLLLLDKPAGLSSNQALQAVRRLLRAEKGGHTGALDPLATGLLPLCFGEATKIAGLLLGARKAYQATVVLGTTTDTDDADGEVLRARPVPALTAAGVEAALGPLTGRIRQRPPVYSALKQGGEPLYAKARRGEAIDVPEREVEVESIALTDFAPPRLQLAVTCGSGTYIRSLARDLGEALGCGAHVATLRRTWVDPFRAPAMHTLPALEALAAEGGPEALDALVLPVDAGLAGFTSVPLDAAGAARIGHGQPVDSPGPAMTNLNLVGPDGRSLGLGRRDEAGRVWPSRLFRWGSRA